MYTACVLKKEISRSKKKGVVAISCMDMIVSELICLLLQFSNYSVPKMSKHLICMSKISRKWTWLISYEEHIGLMASCIICEPPNAAISQMQWPIQISSFHKLLGFAAFL